jgi:hypothetical protein
MGLSFDFDAFESGFRDACLEGVRLIARQYNRTAFYAICVYADGFDGEFGLYANTENHFSQTLQEYKAAYPESYSTAIKVKDLKYDCGDWAFQSLGLPDDFAECVSLRIREWSSQVYDLSYNKRALTTKHYQLFDEIACRIATSPELTNDSAALQKTKDFLVTVSGHDEPAPASIYRPMWYAEKGSLEGFDPYVYSVEA